MPPSQLSLSDLFAQTQGKFSQSSYADAQTGTTVQYALCPPAGYDASKTYPMVTFIGDATTVGKGPSYSLSQGYGAIAWASDYDQAIHPSYVLVPSFDSTVIDDNGGATKTDLLELTARLIVDGDPRCHLGCR
jgi:predicted peptidase